MPGTLSWLDPNNNKAFLDEQISLTNNGISIYYAAKTSTDPEGHGDGGRHQPRQLPDRPVGEPTEFQLFFNQMIFKYTKYPKAAKEFLRFMMEEEQMIRGVQASIGYVAPALTAYEKNPIWTSDPKHTPYRDSMKNMRPSGYAGKMGYASAGDWPTSSSSTWWPRRPLDRRHRRKRPSARRSARSGITRV